LLLTLDECRKGVLHILCGVERSELIDSQHFALLLSGLLDLRVDARRCLSEVQILFQGNRHVPSQLRVAKTCPPGGEVGVGRRVSLIDLGLALKTVGHGQSGPDVVRADRAASKNIGGKEHGKKAFGGHGVDCKQWQL